MSRPPFVATGIDYDENRAQWREADVWDRTVRRVRAVESLRRLGSLDLDMDVQERAGVAVLVDTANPDRIEPL